MCARPDLGGRGLRLPERASGSSHTRHRSEYSLESVYLRVPAPQCALRLMLARCGALVAPTVFISAATLVGTLLASAASGLSLDYGNLAAASLSFFFSSISRHTIFKCDWSSDVCSSD